jgi:IclR family transcriptional regulator, KDG regulon repressor
MSDGVQSLTRALGILETLATSSDGLGISELSRKVRLPASTIHRLLSTLGRNGYVIQLDNEKYRLGHKLIEIGRNFLDSSHLTKIIRPYLEEASRETGETANLVILDKDEALYLDKVESSRILRVFSMIGSRAPLYCTASGKVLLAGFPEEQLRRYLRNTKLKALTPNTITSPAALRNELGTAMARGYAYDLEECELGARCAAVPVMGLRDRILGAISISGPAVRLPKRKLDKAVRYLLEASAEVSARIK